MRNVTLPDPRRTPLISIEEAAKVLGVGKNAAYKMAEAGTLPVVRIGVGRNLKVPVARLLREVLGIDPDTVRL